MTSVSTHQQCATTSGAGSRIHFHVFINNTSSENPVVRKSMYQERDHNLDFGDMDLSYSKEDADNQLTMDEINRILGLTDSMVDKHESTNAARNGYAPTSNEDI